MENEDQHQGSKKHKLMEKEKDEKLHEKMYNRWSKEKPYHYDNYFKDDFVKIADDDTILDFYKDRANTLSKKQPFYKQIFSNIGSKKYDIYAARSIIKIFEDVKRDFIDYLYLEGLILDKELVWPVNDKLTNLYSKRKCKKSKKKSKKKPKKKSNKKYL